MDENKSIIVLHEKQFDEVISIIQLHKAKPLVWWTRNCYRLHGTWEAMYQQSWKVKNGEARWWANLSEYIRARRPDLRGYSRRNIYNMVQYFEEYSTPQFSLTVEKFLSHEFGGSQQLHNYNRLFRSPDDNINEGENNEIGAVVNCTNASSSYNDHFHQSYDDT